MGHIFGLCNHFSIFLGYIFGRSLFYRTNLPKQVMAFPDFPFPDDVKCYMTHSEVNKYLNDYTDHFSLRGLIQFNHQVVNVTPINEDDKQTWEVTVKNLQTDLNKTIIFDAVVVCNGYV